VILLSFFAFTCFSCFACTLPVSFTVLGGPVCPGKVTRRCSRPWRGLPNGVVSSTGCLKHQSDPSLDSWCPAPTPKERPATAAPYRPRVSKNAECSGGGGRSLHGLSFPRVSGNNPASDPLAFGDLVSLRSLSYLWVSGRQRR